MQPVYIQRIASIHPPKDHSPGNNRPYLQACEPDYKDIITNATLRRRMSRIVKMGVACGLECMGELSPENKVLARIRKHLEPGAIILLHDRMPDSDQLVKQILDLLKEQGYTVVRPDKLLA